MVKFPLNNVSIGITSSKLLVESPEHEFEFIRVAPKEISLDVDGLVCLHIKDGKEISIWPYPGADMTLIQDQLLKWGIISILHQRKILNFHASSFSFNDKGVMVCGDTGAGKSSLTAAFGLEEGVFLNDDITAITFVDRQAGIMKLEDKISLHRDSIDQLKQGKKVITLPDGYKHTLKPGGEAKAFTPLNYILAISIEKRSKIKTEEIKGTEKFALLRGNICSWEMLKGMPGLEEEYLRQLIAISSSIPLFLVRRPEKIEVNALKKAVQSIISYDE